MLIRPLSCASCYITCPTVLRLVPFFARLLPFCLFVCCHLSMFVCNRSFCLVDCSCLYRVNSFRQEDSIRLRPAANCLLINPSHCMRSSQMTLQLGEMLVFYCYQCWSCTNTDSVIRYG